MRISLLVALAWFGLAPLTAVSPSGQAAGPRPLYSMAAAFDPVRNRLVVFGGYGDGGYSGETWEWDGAAWHRIEASGPEARNWPVLVFDSRRNRMVLFGGDTRDRIFGDTWSYDGKAWTRLAEDGPTPRSTHGMAYDSARDRIVLFGGFSRREGRIAAGILADTWEFDGRAWTQVAQEGPPGRALQAMAFDASTGKVVMSGGTRMSVPPQESDTLGDTWEWDGTRWTSIAGDAPARDHVSMDYDAAGKRLILVGGAKPGGGQVADVWQRVGARWSRVDTSDTPALAGHHVIYDVRASRILIFGGFGPGQGPTANIWSLNGTAWTLMK